MSVHRNSGIRNFTWAQPPTTAARPIWEPLGADRVGRAVATAASVFIYLQLCSRESHQTSATVQPGYCLVTVWLQPASFSLPSDRDEEAQKTTEPPPPALSISISTPISTVYLCITTD